MVKKRKVMTVAIFYDPSSGKILLGLKKRGFGVGRWNGYGGKVKEGESIRKAARREIFEEAGIIAKDLEEVGKIDFEFVDKPDEILEVHFFKIGGYYGNPRETEEMRPGWFEAHNIPYDLMWPDDKVWMPLFLQGKNFEGRILFRDQDTILESQVSLATLNSNL
jgi:8-oxo-dGTP diphosphatase/2-hydroxy-dATP diphosphatase